MKDLLAISRGNDVLCMRVWSPSLDVVHCSMLKCEIFNKEYFKNIYVLARLLAKYCYTFKGFHVISSSVVLILVNKYYTGNYSA